MIGDSVTVGASAALQKSLPGIAVDAQVSRSILTAPGIVAQMKAEGRLRKYVVISLNTNSATTVGEYERIAARRVMGMCWSSSMRMVTASGFPWPIRRPPTTCASIPPIRFWSTGTVLSRHTPIGSDRTASTRRPDKAKTCMPPV